ncbi:hypothetical protein BXZ70DRAFT_1009700 [Cristinia sonorae]|uniref:Uncharacterized protein n=1 Tax=Cristinia sonorae TaxID=1940300 RepID=A0A8K0UJY3_9AGAR|nr:hypothetical protein BXZ70DRAFT_1009700 [Cristinia sonorae]
MSIPSTSNPNAPHYPTLSPHKMRFCTSCGRPTRGHPRGRCPRPEEAMFAPDPHRVPVPSSPRKPKVHLHPGAQAQVQLHTPEDDQKERRRRRSSIVPTPLADIAHLPSLTPSAMETVQRLEQPGMMDDQRLSDGDRRRANVLRWLSNVVGPEGAQGPLMMVNSNGTRHRSEVAKAGNGERAYATLESKETMTRKVQEAESRGMYARSLWLPMLKEGDVRTGWLVVGRDKGNVDELFEKLMRSDII